MKQAHKLFIYFITVILTIPILVTACSVNGSSDAKLIKTDRLSSLDFRDFWSTFVKVAKLNNTPAKIGEFKLSIDANRIQVVKLQIVTKPLTAGKFNIYYYSQCLHCPNMEENSPYLKRETSKEYPGYAELMPAEYFFSTMNKLPIAQYILSGSTLSTLYTNGRRENIAINGANYYKISSTQIKDIPAPKGPVFNLTIQGSKGDDIHQNIIIFSDLGSSSK